MTSVLLTGLVSTVTRQLRHLRMCTAGHASPAAAVYRCLSSVITTQARTFLPPGIHQQTRMPMLGQCQQLPCVQPFAGMKTKTALKRRCKDCFFVRRRGRLFVFCKTNPRHKQRQG